MSTADAREQTAFEGAKRVFVLSVVAIGGGLAVAGSLDSTTGGVVVVAGWLVAIVGLHRLGRAGSVRTPDAPKRTKKKPPPPDPDPPTEEKAEKDET